MIDRHGERRRDACGTEGQEALPDVAREASSMSARHPLPVHGVPSDGGRCFVSYLERVRPSLDAAIDAALTNPRRATSVSDGRVSVDVGGRVDEDVRRYLREPLRAFVTGGGKRVRPALCLLGAEAVGGDAARALSSAVALELFQSAALVHDDIADHGLTRRGVACMHRSEGVGIAVNAGDQALVDVFASVALDESLDGDTRLAVVGELVAMADRTLEGQALDLGWTRDGRWDVSVDDYLAMATRKTAHYSAAVPLVCGALCGGGSQAQVGALRTFGLRAGLAFQLQDDLLNVVGDSASQGKDLRSDITEGKRTLLVVHALSRLDAVRAAELVAILSSGTTDADELERAVALMDEADSVTFVRDAALGFASEARDALTGANLTSEAVEVLASMADFFVERVG